MRVVKRPRKLYQNTTTKTVSRKSSEVMEGNTIAPPCISYKKPLPAQSSKESLVTAALTVLPKLRRAVIAVNNEELALTRVPSVSVSMVAKIGSCRVGTMYQCTY